MSGNVSEKTYVEDCLLNGSIVDARFGYAVWPVTNERLNALASCRYLYDMFGQETDRIAGQGAVQEAHVANFEKIYDLNSQWTLVASLVVVRSKVPSN